MAHWLWVPGLGTICSPLAGFQMEILNFRIDLPEGTLQVPSLQSAWPEVASKGQSLQGALGPSSAALAANWDKDNPLLPDACVGSLEPGLTKRDKGPLPHSSLLPAGTSPAELTLHTGHLPWSPELVLRLGTRSVPPMDAQCHS